MVFTVLVAADLFGTKINYELDFGEPPSMAVLRARVEAVFGAEAAARRPAGCPASPFQIHRIQTFDDNVELWVDLVSMGQVQDYSQVYVFQRETPWHREVQSKIPPPIKPPQQQQQQQQQQQYQQLPAYAAPPPAHCSAGAWIQSSETSPTRARGGGSPAVPLPHRSPSPVRAPPPVTLPAYRMPPIPAPAAVPIVPAAPPAEFARPETTHADKVRSVFDDLDQRRSGGIAPEDFSAALDRLRVDTGGRNQALFEKCDVNKDGVLSFGEFERFAELYPTVLDSLFYRNRDYWLDRRQKDAIDASQKRLDAHRDRQADARAAAAEAAAAVSAQEGKVLQGRAEVEHCQQREKEAQAMIDAAAQETGRCREDVARKAADVAQCKDKERQAAAAQAEAQGAQQTAAARIRLQKEETERAEARLRDIERLLEEQRREVDRMRGLEAGHEDALRQAERRSQEAEAALMQLQQETRRAADTLAVTEQDLTRAQEREREHVQAHLQARDDSARQAVRRDADERELQAARDRAKIKQQVEADAERAAEAQAAHLQGLRDENAEHNEKRRRTEEEERELIMSEVRIREQRDTLEREEAALRDSHRNFHSSTGRADQPPPPRTHASPRVAGLSASSCRASPARDYGSAYPAPDPGAQTSPRRMYHR